MLVQKEVLSLIEAAQDNTCFNTHKVIRITNQEAQVTDGHMAFKVRLHDQALLEEFPVVSEIKSTEEDIFLTEESVKKILGSLPRKPKHPILNYFYIGKNGKPDEINIVATDIDNTNVINQRLPEIGFPDIQSPFSSCENNSPTLTIGFGIKVLQKALKVAGKLDPQDTIIFRFYDHESPVLAEIGPDAKALIMPVRLDESDYAGDITGPAPEGDQKTEPEAQEPETQEPELQNRPEPGISIPELERLKTTKEENEEKWQIETPSGIKVGEFTTKENSKTCETQEPEPIKNLGGKTPEDLALKIISHWKYDVMDKSTGLLLSETLYLSHSGGGYYEVLDKTTDKAIHSGKLGKNEALGLFLAAPAN